ncbi:MAG: hypothetical protein E7149_02950 [Rikenellaceae bacterium]|nr:hypothetical protein [Rikenellaceae bacterium]
MKKNLIKLFALSAMALVGWSCETDYYNENYLDGYESDDKITDVQQIEYTLAEGDYATIAKNATNKATAEAAGEEAKQALAAIGTNKYFANEDEAGMYIPAFIAASYPTLDDTSVAMVTYRSALEVPAEIGKMNAAKEYTLKKEDYQAIWGSETEFEQALTPATIGKLPEALAAAYATKEIAAGDYVVVTYNYSAEEPKAEEPEEPSTPSDPDEPVQPDEPEVTFGTGTYLIIAQTGETFYTMSWVPADKGYGYPKSSQDFTPENAAIAANETSNAFAFQLEETATAGQYNIREAGDAGRYYYNSGTYKNFSVAATLDSTSEDYAFTITANDDGTVQIKCVSTGRVLQQGDGTYDSYGLYDTQLGSYPRLYKLNAEGTAYVDVAAGGSNPDSGDEPSTPVTDVNTTIAALNAMMTSTKTAITEEYIFEAVVLNDVAGGNYSYNNLILQSEDATTAGNGLVVYGSQVEPSTLGLNKGDKVKVTLYKDIAQLVLYSDMYEVTGPQDAEWCKVEKIGTATIEPVVVTPDQLKAYQSMLVTVKGATTEAAGTWCTAAAAGSHKMTASGATMTVYVKKNATDFVDKGFKATTGDVTGLVTLYKGAEQLTPRSIADVAAFTEGVTARSATALQSSKQYGFYQWDGAKFAAADVAIVQPEDYTEMGQKYGNFSNPAQDDYLPKFLAKNYPYGMEGDKVNVLYRCYAGGANSWRVDEYISNGSAWIKTIYFADMVGQFRKAEGVWKVDRTLELAYTEMGSADFKAFCQYCCNWVYDFVDVPLGAPARDNAGVILSADKVTVGGNSPSGAWWVSSYGNNEWYAGTYAYYGEMNWSGSKARAAWENLGYTGLSDDELIAKMQQNAAIVFQNVLGYMYPEMTPEEYNQVVIKVYDYISKANWAYTFKTVGTGTFEYVEGSLTKL